MAESLVYGNMDPESEDFAPIEMESVCTACEESGTTKILLTKIPFYKEVILMSFECPHCGNRNNELQPGAAAAEHGVELALRVTTPKDLNREVVKSEYCSVAIPDVELEIPAKSQPGEVTTVEGIIERVCRGLEQDQERRQTEAPEAAEAITAFLTRLRALLQLETPFRLVAPTLASEYFYSRQVEILNDPSGNSFIGCPDPTKADPALITSHYSRTLEHRKLLGLADDDETEEAGGEDHLEEDWEREVLRFQVHCPACGAAAEDDMKVVDIPGFKETVVMGTNCSACGYRSSEVKAASGVSPQGLKLTLRVERVEDLSRDVLKSETCDLSIPELELEGGRGALSGVFTTVEGILAGVANELREGSGSLMLGDSAEPGEKSKMESFLARLEAFKSGSQPFTLVLDDPAGNTFIQVLLSLPDAGRLGGARGEVQDGFLPGPTRGLQKRQPALHPRSRRPRWQHFHSEFVIQSLVSDSDGDERLVKEWYERSWEQNEDLGINDMNVDNYQTPTQTADS